MLRFKPSNEIQYFPLHNISLFLGDQEINFNERKTWHDRIEQVIHEDFLHFLVCKILNEL